MPVRATVLAVVDPLAAELRPIPNPRFTAWGLVAWSVGAFGAVLATCALRIEDWLQLPVRAGTVESVRTVLLVLAGASAIGAVALIRPHAGLKPRNVGLAVIGAMPYVTIRPVV